MAAKDGVAPIIIKRKKVIAGGGHHGGAWKVAYADFVTAMMAFFMLMWLLNATTEKQRKGIADYFNPTIPVNRISGGGDGAFGGESVFSEDQIAQVGVGAAAQKPTEENQAKGETGVESESDKAEQEQMQKMAMKIEEALKGLGGESMVSQQLARHIVTRVTDEGLIVEFFDLEGEPLFAQDSAEAMPITIEIARMVQRVFKLVNNEIAINAHSRTYPAMLKKNPVWELTAARAQAFRTILEEQGFETKRVERVTAMADRKPAATNPMLPRNNRIEVILLRSDRKKTP